MKANLRCGSFNPNTELSELPISCWFVWQIKMIELWRSPAEHYETHWAPVIQLLELIMKETSLEFHKKQGASCLKTWLRLTNMLISRSRISLIFRGPRCPQRLTSELQFEVFKFSSQSWEMSSTLRTVLHLAGFSWYALVVKYLAAKDGDQLPKGIFAYGGPWKYLTFLNLVRAFVVEGFYTL